MGKWLKNSNTTYMDKLTLINGGMKVVLAKDSVTDGEAFKIVSFGIMRNEAGKKLKAELKADGYELGEWEWEYARQCARDAQAKELHKWSV